MLKKLFFPGLLFILLSLRANALIPDLSLENIYEEDKVFLKVKGEPNAPVALFYTPDFASTSFSAIVGWTDAIDGTFWKVIKTSTYRIDSHIPVFVIINGYTSATTTWPYSPPVIPPFSISTTTVVVPLLSTSTLPISGNGKYEVSDNQSAFIASATTSTTTLTLFGKLLGATSITVCQSRSECAFITVRVEATSTPAALVTGKIFTDKLLSTSTSTSTSTGMTDTFNEPFIPIYTPPQYKFFKLLKYGSKGTEVEELQKRLVEEGFFSGDVTGFYGAVTAYAVREYQRANNIPALGILGPMTRERLNGYGNPSL